MFEWSNQDRKFATNCNENRKCSCINKTEEKWQRGDFANINSKYKPNTIYRTRSYLVKPNESNIKKKNVMNTNNV